MTTRTFKQLGQAYGTNPVTVVAKINGVEVFNGTISAVDSQPVFTYPSEVQDLFSWTSDVDFSGNVEMEVSASGGKLLLTETVANYIKIIDAENPPPGVTSGAGVFGIFYFQDVDGTTLSDPRTNIVIGGESQIPSRNTGLLGQYYWLIPSETTCTSTITIQPGYETNPVFPPDPGV
jgi:hypothetical protein